MAKCMYYKCTKTSKDNVSLFQFPTRYPDCLREWIENSGNASLISLSNEVLRKRFICSDHFRPDQIHNGQRKRLIGLATPKPYYLSKRAGMAAAPFDPEKVQTTYNRSKQATPRLSPNVVPSQFSWNQQKEDGKKEIKEEGPVWEVSLDCSETKGAIQYGAEVKAKQLSNCRCCLSFGEHVKLEKEHNATLLKLSIFLQDDSRLPDRICQVCITNLTRFSEFRSMVIETQKRLVGAVTGGVKLQPRGLSSPAPTPDPLAFPEVEIKVERPDDDDDDEANNDDVDDTDDAYTEASFDQNEDMEDRKDMVFKDGLLPALDDTTQNTPDPLEVNSPTVTSEVQPKLQKILVPILNQKNLPVMAPGQAPKRLRLITPDMATKLGLIPVPSTSMSPSEPALQLRGNMQQNVRVIRLPRAMQQMMAKQTHTQGIRAIAPTSNVRPAVGEADASKQTQICVKSEPGESAATTSTHSADPDTSETDDAEDINTTEDDSKKRQSSDTTEEGASKMKRRKKQVSSESLEIGGAAVTATQKSRLRADIVQTVHNTNIIPFVPYKTQFKCLYCDTRHTDFLAFKNHVLTDHKNVSELTTYNSMLTRAFRQNNMLHADISDLKCTICNENIDDLNSLFQHMKRKHFKLYFDFYGEDYKGPPHGILGFRLEKKPLQCIICSKQCKSFGPLKTHMADHYDFFSCQYCGKKIISYRTHKLHTQKHKMELDSGNSKTNCKFCDKTFKYSHEKTNHLYGSAKNAQGTQRLLKCCFCPQTFPLKELVKIEHMKERHGYVRGEFKCQFCDKVYEIKRSLAYHIEKHHAENSEKCAVCDKCGYICRDKYYMIRHLESHEGIRKFECGVCRKMFRSKSTLALHLMGHNNQKRYKCRLCDTAFIQKHCVKSHIKSKHSDAGVDVEALILKCR